MDTTNQMDSEMTEIRFVRQSAVLKMVPFSSATLWRMVGNGTFPAPVKLSKKVTAWKWSELRKWAQMQEANHAA